MKRGLAESGVLAEISPLYQTCKLLQMNKTNDVMEMKSMRAFNFLGRVIS